MSSLYDYLLDLVFPPRCPGCRTRGVLLCSRCIRRCRDLRSRSASNPRYPELATVAGLYHFAPPLREAIHTFKYRRRRALAGPLGALLVDALPGEARTCEVVAPVPLHPSRLRERGFNQSALLAASIATALGCPTTDELQRTRATEHQVGLDLDEREANVRDAFAWQGGPVPRSIMLVDDVLTTGATLRACAVALRAVGVEEVRAVALARG